MKKRKSPSTLRRDKERRRQYLARKALERDRRRELAQAAEGQANG